MKKAVLYGGTVLLIAVVSVGAFVGVGHWKKKEEMAALRPHVKVATIHLTSVLEVEVNPGNITYKDYFNKTDNAISEIEKSQIQMRSVSTERTAEELKQAIIYTDAAKSLIRELTTVNRQKSRAESFSELAEGELSDSRSSNTYTAKFSTDRRLKYLQEAIDAYEKASKSLGAIKPLSEAVRSFIPYIESRYGSDAAPPSSLLDELVNEKKK